MSNNNNFQEVIENLNQFIQKFYLNKLIKGAIISSGLLISYFLILLFLESLGNFNSIIRTVLFYSFIVYGLIVFIKYITFPVFQLLKLGNRLTYEEASHLIENHFSGLGDKIINSLQLNNLSQENHRNNELIIAGLSQKAKELKPFNFSIAINFKNNRKYLKYAIIPISVFCVVFLSSPTLIKDSSNRILNYNIEFQPKTPFVFNIKPNQITLLKGEDLKIKSSISGSLIPENAFLKTGESSYKMSKSGDLFEYELKNLQKSFSFQLVSGDVTSSVVSVKVLAKPSIIGFVTRFDYPKHTKLKNESISNTGDFIIPEGTNVGWFFETEETTDVLMSLKDSATPLIQISENKFKFQKTILTSEEYSVLIKNQNIKSYDSSSYFIRIIKDQHPSISTNEHGDSLNEKNRYFSGIIKDDYGLNHLTFNYLIKNEKGALLKENQQNVSFDKSQKSSEFFHYFDFNLIRLNPGDKIEYYFEVWDNDGVNGSKSSRSSTYQFKALTAEEILAKTDQNAEKIKDNLEKNLEEVKNLNQELEEIKQKLLDKKKLSWEDKKQIEEFLKKQKELERELNKLKQENQERNELSSQLEQPNKSLLEKQEKLEDLFEKIMTDEMKKLFEEMEKLMENFDKKKVQNKLEEMDLSNEDLEKELDRTLEIFKQLEFEQALEEAIQKLEKLSDEQKKLAEEKLNSGEKLEKQDELNEAFEKLQEDIDDLEKKNEELEEKNDLPETQSLEEQIKEEMKESSEQLQKQNKKSAKESQQGASEKMEEMKNHMESFQSSMASQQQSENIESLRALLENLIQMSFDQEALIEKTKELKRKDPKYVDVSVEQKRIKDNAQIIEDSLFALSKRVVEIESIVNREMNLINSNMEKSIKELSDRKAIDASNRQQFVMTSTNNLALLLDEILLTMQQQMSQSKFGSGSCSKPGSGKPSMSDMKKAQKSLNKKMKEMLEKQQGQNPGEKPNGQMQGGKGGKMSKELAKLAAEQSALRSEMQKLQDQLNGDKEGNSGSGNLKKMEDLMEQTERDLVNYEISLETIKRQEEIITRLLQAENAEREQEMEKKRESKEHFGSTDQNNQKQFEEYFKQRKKENEILRTISPNLSPYYKEKANQYFNDI